MELCILSIHQDIYLDGMGPGAYTGVSWSRYIGDWMIKLLALKTAVYYLPTRLYTWMEWDQERTQEGPGPDIYRRLDD